jgi:hypothetical protein
VSVLDKARSAKSEALPLRPISCAPHAGILAQAGLWFGEPIHDPTEHPLAAFKLIKGNAFIGFVRVGDMARTANDDWNAKPLLEQAALRSKVDTADVQRTAELAGQPNHRRIDRCRQTRVSVENIDLDAGIVEAPFTELCQLISLRGNLVEENLRIVRRESSNFNFNAAGGWNDVQCGATMNNPNMER